MLMDKNSPPKKKKIIKKYKNCLVEARAYTYENKNVK